MQLLTKTDGILHNYNVLDNNVFLKKKINIIFDCGSIVRNFYISNNSWGNILIYGFYDADNDFILVDETADNNKKIKGAEFFVHDAIYHDNKIYILTESGDIFYFNESSPSELFFEKNVLEGVSLIEGERSYSFTYDDDNKDFIVTSNSRMIYPSSDFVYNINLENPVFVNNNIVASDICKTAIDIETGGPVQFVDAICASGHGFLVGKSKNVKDAYKKILAGPSIQEIDGKFNSGCQIGDNLFVFYFTQNQHNSEFRIISVEKTDEDAILGQF